LRVLGIVCRQRDTVQELRVLGIVCRQRDAMGVLSGNMCRQIIIIPQKVV